MRALKKQRMYGLGTFVLKLPGDIGEIIVSKKQSTFYTNVLSKGVDFNWQTRFGYTFHFRNFAEVRRLARYVQF